MSYLVALLALASTCSTMKLYHNFPVCCKGSQFLKDLVGDYADNFHKVLALSNDDLCEAVEQDVKEFKRKIEGAGCSGADCSQLVEQIERSLTSDDQCTRDMNFLRSIFDLVAMAYEHAGNKTVAKQFRKQANKIDNLLKDHAQEIFTDVPKGNHKKQAARGNHAVESDTESD